MKTEYYGTKRPWLAEFWLKLSRKRKAAVVKLLSRQVKILADVILVSMPNKSKGLVFGGLHHVVIQSENSQLNHCTSYG